MSNRQYEELLERQKDEAIAAHLGLTYDEYRSLDPSDLQDGNGVTTYLIEFQAPITKSIADKIDGLKGNAVEVPTWVLDDDEEDPGPHD